MGQEAGQKRKWGGGGKNDIKRKKLDIPPGSRGILFSCGSPAVSRDAVREFMMILKKHVGEPVLPCKGRNGGKEGEVQPAEGKAEPSGEDVKPDVEEAIALELAELKQEEQRFVLIKDFHKGLHFVRFTREADVPSEVVHALFKSVKDGVASFSCRFVNRVLPVDITCKPHPPDFEKAVADLIRAHFPHSVAAAENNPNLEVPACVPVSTWAMQYNARSMKTLDRLKCAEVAGKLVGENYKVNLSNAELSVCVEVAPLMCGMAVVRDFNLFLKYNLHRMCHPEDEEQIAAQSIKSKEEKEKSKEEKEKSKEKENE